MLPEESCKLAGTDERDLPSAKASAPKALVKKKKKLDREKRAVFAGSKMRDAIVCCECNRPRLIYSMNKPKPKQLAALDAYKEGVDFMCGDALFDADEVAEDDDAKTLPASPG